MAQSTSTDLPTPHDDSSSAKASPSLPQRSSSLILGSLQTVNGTVSGSTPNHPIPTHSSASSKDHMNNADSSSQQIKDHSNGEDFSLSPPAEDTFQNPSPASTSITVNVLTVEDQSVHADSSNAHIKEDSINAPTSIQKDQTVHVDSSNSYVKEDSINRVTSIQKNQHMDVSDQPVNDHSNVAINEVGNTTSHIYQTVTAVHMTAEIDVVVAKDGVVVSQEIVRVEETMISQTTNGSVYDEPDNNVPTKSLASNVVKESDIDNGKKKASAGSYSSGTNSKTVSWKPNADSPDFLDANLTSPPVRFPSDEPRAEDSFVVSPVTNAAIQKLLQESSGNNASSSSACSPTRPSAIKTDFKSVDPHVRRPESDGGTSDHSFDPNDLLSNPTNSDNEQISDSAMVSPLDVPPFNPVWSPEQQEEWRRAKKEARKRGKANRENGLRHKGTKITEGHANYVLMYDMLTGIRHAVSGCVAKPYRDLEAADFREKNKLVFDIMGNELTSSSKYEFKFKDYAPWVFRHIRELFRVEAAEYLVSLTGKYVLSELGSPGKSGSFFYFSQDYRFIIKTVHHTEHKFLLSILELYYKHIKKYPHTLLCRYYGLHRVKLPHGRKIHFVVMGNVEPPNKDIHERFDLKGSLVGREVKYDEIKNNPYMVMKDLNWIKMNRRLMLGPEKAKWFLEQMQKDVDLLLRLNVMDYSLLLGIHYLKRGNSENIRDKSLCVFDPNTSSLDRPSSPLRSPLTQSRAVTMRRAIASSDPVQLGPSTNKLPDKSPAERLGFKFYQDDGGFLATDEHDRPMGELYYCGIIDILTPYNTMKKAEHAFKSLKYDKHLISAVGPAEYSHRFLDFMKTKVVSTKGSIAASRFRTLNTVLSDSESSSTSRSPTDDGSNGNKNNSSTTSPSSPGKRRLSWKVWKRNESDGNASATGESDAEPGNRI